MNPCYKEPDAGASSIEEMDTIDVQLQSEQCIERQKSPRTAKDGAQSSFDITSQVEVITSKERVVTSKNGIGIFNNGAGTSKDAVNTSNVGAGTFKDAVNAINAGAGSSKDKNVNVGAGTSNDESINVGDGTSNDESINVGAKTSKYESINVGAKTSKYENINVGAGTSKDGTGPFKYPRTSKAGVSKRYRMKTFSKAENFYRVNNILDKIASVSAAFKSELEKTEMRMGEHLEMIKREKSQFSEIGNSIKEIQSDLKYQFESETNDSEEVLGQIESKEQQLVKLLREKAMKEEEMRILTQSEYSDTMGE